MNRIKDNKEFLDFLCKSNKKLRKILIQHASKEQNNTICEIILNILKGNFQIPKEKLSILNKKKNQLRAIIQKTPLKKKKHIIQKGGFLEILIPAIVSGLASIVSNLIQ